MRLYNDTSLQAQPIMMFFSQGPQSSLGAGQERIKSQEADREESPASSPRL